MNGIESPILSYSDPIQFSQVPLTQFCTFWTENLHSFAPSGRDFFFYLILHLSDGNFEIC